MTHLEPARRKRLLLARACLCSAALLCVLLCGLRIFGLEEGDFLATIANDDAYYYFQTARNFAHGLGQSFDGLEPTDGCRPIWLFALVPIFSLVPDASLAARLGCFLGVLLGVAALLLLARLLGRRLDPLATALACSAALLAWPLRKLSMFGMDWGLNLLLMVAAVGTCAAILRSPKRAGAPRLVAAGLLLGALMWQRPDAGVLVVLIGLLFLRRPGGLRSALQLGLGAVLFALPAFLASWQAFGHPLPIAGRVKNSTALAVLSPENFGEALEHIALVVLPQPTLALLGGSILGLPRALPLLALLALIALGTLGLLRAARGAGGVGAIALPLLGNALLHALIAAAFLHPYVTQGRWYFAPQDLAGTVLLAGILHLLAALPRGLYSALAGILTGLLLGQVYQSERRADAELPVPSNHANRVALDVAAWIHSELPHDARIGVFNAGRIAYYVDGHVVNLDGLMNTHTFFEQVLDREDHAAVQRAYLVYFARKGLDYHVDLWPDAMRGKWHREAFGELGEQLEQLFRYERAWPAHATYDGTRPASYQLYRFDVDAARELLKKHTFD